MTTNSIHVQAWSGSGGIRITEMLNAGKRGKRCRAMRFQGSFSSYSPTEAHERAHTLTMVAIGWAQSLDLGTPFDAAKAHLEALIAQYGPLPEGYAALYQEDIRGVDAPREKLTAGVPHRWSAKVDESGVFVSDDSDRHNEPALCTHQQTNGSAYERAARVWESVRACKSFSEVWEVLSGAGCKLHYWCRMD